LNEEKIIELRKKILKSAIRKSFEHFPIVYAMMCYDDKTKLFNVLVKFSDKPNLHASDMHDYIYTRYGIDPRFYVVNSLNPMTRLRMLEECEFVEGNREEYEKDLERAREEAKRFEDNLRDVARLYGVLGRE